MNCVEDRGSTHSARGRVVVRPAEGEGTIDHSLVRKDCSQEKHERRLFRQIRESGTAEKAQD
jgi:hypothetical protein